MLMSAWLIATSEQVRVWDGKTEELLSHSSRGFGVRVLVDGAWGFAGSPDLTSGRQTVAIALEVARVQCLPAERAGQCWRPPRPAHSLAEPGPS